MKTDKARCEYLKLSNAKAGDVVKLDPGFTCRRAGFVALEKDANGELFFPCNDGKHYIAGQADDGVHCIGIYNTK